MSYRAFTDRQGNRWQVRPLAKREWLFEPLPGNPEARQVAVPPGYEEDPFELSDQEIQRVLDSARAASAGPGRTSPFRDDTRDIQDKPARPSTSKRPPNWPFKD
jgi:hypothetical protein